MFQFLWWVDYAIYPEDLNVMQSGGCLRVSILNSPWGRMHSRWLLVW